MYVCIIRYTYSFSLLTCWRNITGRALFHMQYYITHIGLHYTIYIRFNDHNFLQFLPIFGNDIGVYLEIKVMIKVVHIVILFRVQFLCVFWPKHLKNYNTGR